MGLIDGVHLWAIQSRVTQPAYEIHVINMSPVLPPLGTDLPVGLFQQFFDRSWNFNTNAVPIGGFVCDRYKGLVHYVTSVQFGRGLTADERRAAENGSGGKYAAQARRERATWPEVMGFVPQHRE
jgi:hypothetical protein